MRTVLFTFSRIVADPHKGLGLVLDDYQRSVSRPIRDESGRDDQISALGDRSAVVANVRTGSYLVLDLEQMIDRQAGRDRSPGELWTFSNQDLFMDYNWRVNSVDEDVIWVDYPVIPPGWEGAPNVAQLPQFSDQIELKAYAIAQNCPWNQNQIDHSFGQGLGMEDSKQGNASCNNQNKKVDMATVPKMPSWLTKKNVLTAALVIAGLVIGYKILGADE